MIARANLLDVQAEKVRRDACQYDRLRDYVGAAWNVIEPATPFVGNWHIDAISEHLEAVSARQIRKLIINIPPRHMKSLQASVFWPTWEWGPAHRPYTRWLFASYAEDLSTRDSVKCRRIIQSPWYQARWGDVYQLVTDQNVKRRFETTAMGYRLATSVDGQLTGEGGDIIVIDDAHNVRDGESEAKRTSCLEWWDRAMSTRLNDPRTGAYVIIMQRIHEDDLTGHILANEHGWDHLMLPCQYEPTHPHALVSGIGFKDPRTKEGELIWPSRFGEPEIEEMKVKLGSYGAAGQLQQRPSPSGGGVFSREWFRYYRDGDDHYELIMGNHLVRRVLKTDTWRIITADLAFTTKEMSDWTVIQVWDVEKIRAQKFPTDRVQKAQAIHDQYEMRGGAMILVAQFRARMETPAVEDQLINAYAKYKPIWIGIEDRHCGTAVIQRFIRDGLPIVPLEDKTCDKVTRARAGAIYMENGYFHHPGLRECFFEQSFNQVCILLDSELVNQLENLFVFTTTFPLSQFGQFIIWVSFGGCW